VDNFQSTLPISNSKTKTWTVSGVDSMTNFPIKRYIPRKDLTNQNPNLPIWHISQERKDSYISRDKVKTHSRFFLISFPTYLFGARSLVPTWISGLVNKRNFQSDQLNDWLIIPRPLPKELIHTRLSDFCDPADQTTSKTLQSTFSHIKQ